MIDINSFKLEFGRSNGIPRQPGFLVLPFNEFKLKASIQPFTTLID